MERRVWQPKEKLQIVLAGLKGEVSVAELCTRHQVSQSQFYAWRDQLLSEGAKLFERGGPDREAERLRAQNLRLRTIIGDLTAELKKNDF